MSAQDGQGPGAVPDWLKVTPTDVPGFVSERQRQARKLGAQRRAEREFAEELLGDDGDHIEDQLTRMRRTVLALVHLLTPEQKQALLQKRRGY